MNYHFKISISGKTLPQIMDTKGVEMTGAAITSIDYERPEDAQKALRNEMRKVLESVNFLDMYGLLVEQNPEISNVPPITNTWMPHIHSIMWIYPKESENKITDSIVMGQVISNHPTSYNSTIQ